MRFNFFFNRLKKSAQLCRCFSHSAYCNQVRGRSSRCISSLRRVSSAGLTAFFLWQVCWQMHSVEQNGAAANINNNT